MTAFTPDPALAYPCAPRQGKDHCATLGRFLLAVGTRPDLPREYGFSGDREIGWAGLTLGHLYLTLCWR